MAQLQATAHVPWENKVLARALLKIPYYHPLSAACKVSVTLVGEHLGIDQIEWQLGINLWGVIYGSKAFLPQMLAQREC